MITEEMALELFRDPSIQTEVVNAICDCLGIRGEMRVAFVKSIGMARLKDEWDKRIKSGKPDQELVLEYQNFVRTREKELAARSHTERTTLSLGTLGDRGKRSFVKTLKAEMGRVFRHSLYPDPHFFDR